MQSLHASSAITPTGFNVWVDEHVSHVESCLKAVDEALGSRSTEPLDPAMEALRLSVARLGQIATPVQLRGQPLSADTHRRMRRCQARLQGLQQYLALAHAGTTRVLHQVLPPVDPAQATYGAAVGRGISLQG